MKFGVLNGVFLGKLFNQDALISHAGLGVDHQFYVLFNFYKNIINTYIHNDLLYHLLFFFSKI